MVCRGARALPQVRILHAVEPAALVEWLKTTAIPYRLFPDIVFRYDGLPIYRRRSHSAANHLPTNDGFNRTSDTLLFPPGRLSFSPSFRRHHLHSIHRKRRFSAGFHCGPSDFLTSESNALMRALSLLFLAIAHSLNHE